jgi:hypothetical protein
MASQRRADVRGAHAAELRRLPVISLTGLGAPGLRLTATRLSEIRPAHLSAPLLRTPQTRLSEIRPAHLSAPLLRLAGIGIVALLIARTRVSSSGA